MSDFKYKEQITALLKRGIKLPHLHKPNGIKAFRFAFESKPDKNHLPALIQKPSRRLPDEALMSGYALSCFDDETKAVDRYRNLQESFPRISKTIGDSICQGNIGNDDGLVTKVDSNSGHFDLYEFLECDLNKSFKIKYSLL
ncbi:MAG: hypothetical protein K5854_06995 [Prevotella sp.]|nr:hypothetical protein [Prevotella sp.]